MKAIKPIPGYESQYSIDNEGNVYSMPRRVPTGIQEMSRPIAPRILKPYIDKQGRSIIYLWKNGKKKCYEVKNMLKRTFD